MTVRYTLHGLYSGPHEAEDDRTYALYGEFRIQLFGP